MSIKMIFEEGKKSNFPDSVFITGFHGIGWTGYIAIRHLIKTAKAEKIGYLMGDVIPDIISIEDEHLILPFEFYSYKNFVMFQPPLQPILLEQRKIIQELAQWIVNSNFKEAVLIGGLDIRFQQESKDLRLVPTKAFVSKGRKFDNPYLEKGLLIRGPLALLLTHLEVLNFPAVVILPFANPDRPDPAAAAVSIDFLNKNYQLDISTSQLLTDAKLIEDEIAEILRQERERTEREPHDMYI